MLRILLVNINIRCPFSTLLLHSTSSVVFSLCFLCLVGDKMGMLEDVCVSIANLTCVKFKVNETFELHLLILYKT